MDRVLVTGANGFIGSNLCRYFLQRSYEVYGLVRESSNLHFLEALPVRLVRGDLAAPQSIRLPDRIDYVIHAASVASEQASRSAAIRNIHDTTVNLVSLLEGRGVALRRFIYISSTLVLGYKGGNISEENPGAVMPSFWYTRAKVMAEEFLRERNRQAGFPVIILRPSDVYGPNDRTMSMLVLDGIEKGVPPIVGHGDSIFSFCYVDNLCLACLLACRMQGENGKAYTVANGTDTTWRQFFGIFLQRLGKRQRVYTPVSLAYVVASIMQILHAVVPSFEAKLTGYRIHRITTDTNYDISETVQALGYQPDQDTERQVNAIVDWYLAEKEAGALPMLMKVKR
jgi:nucleoside-diphosphate-sugar epimerase